MHILDRLRRLFSARLALNAQIPTGNSSQMQDAATQFFNKLNAGWNADPNVPEPIVRCVGHDVVLEFFLNAYAFGNFEHGSRGVLRFIDCARYRLGKTNDEGWYRGQCRYSKIAPAWGEFYEITGPDPLRDQPNDWVNVGSPLQGCRHFLFYLRDETFECLARDWIIEPIGTNALHA